MPVMEYLERNAMLYGDEIALVELNPAVADGRRMSWKEFSLIESNSFATIRRKTVRFNQAEFFPGAASGAAIKLRF